MEKVSEIDEEDYDSDDSVVFLKSNYHEYQKKHSNQFENDPDFENNTIQGQFKNIPISPMNIEIGAQQNPRYL